MTWDVTLAVLFAAAIHAGWNALVKRGANPLFETTLLHAAVAPLALIGVSVLPAPGPTAWLCLLASTAVHCLYYFALASAYRHADLSVAYPILRGSAPMFTALLGVLALGEQPAALGWLGIAGVCGGVLTIGGARARGIAPIARTRAIQWALATAATIVAYTLIDSVGARSAPSAWSYIAWLALIQGPSMALLVSVRQGRALWAYAGTRGLTPLAAGTASMLAYGIALWAMTRAPVALVAALRESSVLFALLIARFMLGEQLDRSRWIGAGAILAGVFALRLG